MISSRLPDTVLDLFEIENEIMKIPYVLECAVTAIPDGTRGQAIKATIVLTEGTVGDDNLKKELKALFQGEHGELQTSSCDRICR